LNNLPEAREEMEKNKFTRVVTDGLDGKWI